MTARSLRNLCAPILGGLGGWLLAAVITIFRMDTGPDWVPVLMLVLPFLGALGSGWAVYAAVAS